ncbi:MAG: ISKra4 family transposase [Pseudomonadales bacterium]|nr:ISKra4 family transposase [Pseudomonadales bacterium]
MSRAADDRAGRGRSREKGGFAETVAAELGAEVERLIGAGPADGIDFEAVETAARRLALEVVGKALAARLNADRTDEKGSGQPCACGATARYAGRRPKTFTTALGELGLERAWYHCKRCGAGFAPRDRALGLEGTSLSAAALRMTGLAAARVSFGETSELLRELAGLDIDAKSAERHAEALGREVADDELAVVEPEPTDARTLYLGLDGTGVPVRKAETAGRKGKQPDGSARTREAKIVAVWSAETLDRDGHPVRDADSATYSAAIETVAGRDTDTAPSPFAARALREAGRRCFASAPRRVVLGDGAAWIWNWADEHAPGAIQIVDIFHAKQHLSEVAKAIYGAGTDLADRWGKTRRDELDQGRLDDILAALRAHADSCDDARKCIDYIDANRHRMRYPEFRGMGLCVATGVVEGGCKNIVGSRLKRGGMHWTVDGANAIVALRCAILSNRFDDFWERRACRKTTAVSQI